MKVKDKKIKIPASYEEYLLLSTEDKLRLMKQEKRKRKKRNDTIAISIKEIK